MEYEFVDYMKWEDVLQNIIKQQRWLMSRNVSCNVNICPVCGCEMVVRKGKYGEFWGCSGYPWCVHTKPMEQPKANDLEKQATKFLAEHGVRRDGSV